MTFRLIPVLLILIGSLRIASSWTQFTQTFDEGFHIACGMQWWDEGRYTREYLHPPLARIAVAAGPYFAGIRAKGLLSSPEEGTAILLDGGHYWRNLVLARTAILPFFWLACFAVWSTSRRLYGDKVALAALGIFSFLPPILGHSAIATTDAAAMATFAFAFDRLHAWFVKPSRWGIVLAGFALGLAVASKFSNILYLGIAIIVLIAFYRRGLRLLMAIPIALLVLTATYRFRKEFPNGPTPPLPANAAFTDRVMNFGSRLCNLRAFWYPAYKGIEEVRKHNEEGHYTYLLGRSYHGSDWRFFPVVLGVKTPLAVLLLFLLALRRQTLLPAILTLLFFVALLPSNINLGVRHALHLYVPMSMVAGWGVIHLSRWLAIPLASWLVIASILAHPNYFSYFNEIASKRPERFLAESDLDWGQDVPQLVRLLDKQGIVSCQLAYWGQANYQAIYPGRFVDFANSGMPAHGCFAVSVRLLTLDSMFSIQDGNGDPWKWLRNQPELGRAGGSIIVYKLP